MGDVGGFEALQGTEQLKKHGPFSNQLACLPLCKSEKRNPNCVNATHY